VDQIAQKQVLEIFVASLATREKIALRECAAYDGARYQGNGFDGVSSGSPCGDYQGRLCFKSATKIHG
jgi:hypothetical protein